MSRGFSYLVLSSLVNLILINSVPDCDGCVTTYSVPEVDSVHLAMPNLHFLPCTPVNFEFEDDVYIATSEPHGFIEAVVTRGHIAPHARF